ncbi:MarR family winged helix-turn-helix transcriptional regulator [Alkalihalobacillus trypoxylicola]|uniref:HTH marR-type domain-containing protein n=1 Tax=Alkalihalobacillus trypoxylicola TaxID=519424 RepID=A0A162ENU7_9BACI|nr:MarR family transcriptional regulator [Alkalihalobacillus trypoxylicola]KYG33368.1 hypothetical protein AZF04_16780 [Alkalihalobacillus trypoxylicola]
MSDCLIKLNIFMKLQTVNKDLCSSFESCLGASPSRVEILHVLLEHDEILQSVLQKKVNIDPAAITRHLKQLETSGMITRYKKPNDQRSTWVKLDDVSKLEIQQSYKEKKKFIDEMFLHFSDKELKEFLSMLNKIEENVSQNH